MPACNRMIPDILTIETPHSTCCILMKKLDKTTVIVSKTSRNLHADRNPLTIMYIDYE